MTRNRAAEIVNKIHDLAEELAGLRVHQPQSTSRRNRHRHLRPGRRVLITRGDKYHLRKGELSHRHSPDSDYWHIKLDLLPGQVKHQVIKKTPTGFRVYPENYTY